MSHYYLPYVRHQAKDGITLTARNAKGKIITSGAGETMEEALEDLKAFVCEVMTGHAENGKNPLSILHYGRLPEDALLLEHASIFPVILRWLRCSMGLTQAEAASRLGIQQPSYAKYEQLGVNPSLELILKIEMALDVSILELLTGAKAA